MNSDAFHSAHEQVVNLVKTFGDSHVKYMAQDYNESAARKDFIDKFFIALGWDVNHDTQTNPYEQEVKVERSVSVAARVKKADYAFFLKPNFGQERFFVEAKRPSASLNNPDSVFQTIRYAFSSSKAALSILTNFDEMHVIDCRFRPDISTATNHVHKKFHFTDFYDLTKFGEIYYLFGRDAVEDGALERYAETLPKPKGKAVMRRLSGDNYQEIDDAFLVLLEGYREELAKMFKRKNEELDSDSLTEAVQRTIDRLVFIRFLEDKLIEPSTILDKFGDEPHPWKKFIAKSREFDKTYNGIIFKNHPVIDREDFDVDDKVFVEITDSLADKYSPYHFNYIPIHILGSIYERFLGSVIVATAKRATVEQKPEVRKAGGVFYTPQYIVKYIVENTIGTLLLGVPPSGGSSLSGKPAKAGTPNAVTPADVAKMRFADIACGSGSFLLGAYEYLLAWHTKYYNERATKTEGKQAGCITNDDGSFALSFEQKKEILVNNIYGVDIDRQAYEVTQLSLFLKLLEDETQGTKQQFLTGHRETMLPSLAKNIVCGNALVDWDITGGDLFEQIDNDKQIKLNPMSFEQKFPEIMRNGGFDAIIGNPPYVDIKGLPQMEVNYLFAKYASANNRVNLFAAFIEKSLDLVEVSNFRLSFIVPTAMLTQDSYKALRKKIIDSFHVNAVARLPNESFGKTAGDVKVDTAIIVIGAKKSTKQDVEIIAYSGYTRITAIAPETASIYGRVDQDDWANDVDFIWSLSLSRDIDSLLRKIESAGMPFEMCADFCLGLTPYDKYKGHTPKQIKDKVFHANTQKDATFKRLLAGNDVRQYVVEWNGEDWISYGSWLGAPREQRFFTEKRILVKQIIDWSTKKIWAAQTSEELYNTQNAFNILPKAPFTTEYLLGLINSKLINFYHQKKFLDEFKMRFQKILIKDAKRFPIHKIDITNADEKAGHDVIVRAVEQIMEAKPKLAAAGSDRERDFWQNKCDSLERTIDDAVYKLYNLTPDEIKLVEAA